ncbi:MAG: hypothetical protein WA118_04005 [Carboxydocellales bacterium]
MTDLAKRRRARKNKQNMQNEQNEQEFFPKGILDVIQTDYPERYVMMLEDTPVKRLFADEEWLDILTKARNSFESHRRLVSPKFRDLP